MITYHKIETVFNRDIEGTKKLIPYDWRDPTVEFLKNCTWEWTEKIDGTNIGVYWDGHKVSFQGRTEKAQIPKFLLEKLEELFGGEENEQIFEQMFGEKEVVQGEWICKINDESVCEEWECSKCGNWNFVKTDFCPNCGAKMKCGEEL